MTATEPPLRVSVRRRAGLAEIVLDGELDTATAPRLAAALRKLLDAEDAPQLVVVDAGGLRFADVSGLDPLLEAARRLAVPGAVRLRNGNATLLRMIQVLRLGDLLGVDG